MFRNNLKLAIVLIGSAEAEREIKFAEKEGFKTRIYNLPADITTTQLRKKMAEISHIKENNGVILQFPLPKHINAQYALNGIISRKDINVVSSRAFGNFAVGRGRIFPPFIGAIKDILEKNNMEIKEKKITIENFDVVNLRQLTVWLINEGANIFCSPEEADIVIGLDARGVFLKIENKEFAISNDLITEMIFKNLKELNPVKD